MTTQVTDATQANLFSAVEGFLIQFSTPELKDDGKHVLIGFSNDQTLPDDGNDFCVLSPLSFSRRGTNVEQWNGVEKAVTYLEYVDTSWQIDCYSGSPNWAQRRAQTYEIIARSEAGVNYFKPLGVDCQYADSVSNLSGVLDSAKYVARWGITLHLGFWKQVSVSFPFFDALTVNVKNVDVSFPP